MDETSNLLLPYIIAAQAQKHVTHNEALRKLDALVQISVVDRDLSAPPAAPAEGARYTIAAAPAGAWTGHTGKLAAWQDGAWAIFTPRKGWLAWVEDEGTPVAWNGTAWVAAGGVSSVNPVALVGVNATADTTNRLAESSPASLFNHGGAGHQMKINKKGAADTASILFRTGFSGRAEMGTAGSDDYAFKVSPDGTNWLNAILINIGIWCARLPGRPHQCKSSCGSRRCLGWPRLHDRPVVHRGCRFGADRHRPSRCQTNRHRRVDVCLRTEPRHHGANIVGYNSSRGRLIHHTASTNAGGAIAASVSTIKSVAASNKLVSVRRVGTSQINAIHTINSTASTVATDTTGLASNIPFLGSPTSGSNTDARTD